MPLYEMLRLFIAELRAVRSRVLGRDSESTEGLDMLESEIDAALVPAEKEGE